MADLGALADLPPPGASPPPASGPLGALANLPPPDEHAITGTPTAAEAVSELGHHAVSQLGHGLWGNFQALMNRGRPNWMGGTTPEEADKQLAATMAGTYQPSNPELARLAQTYDRKVGEFFSGPPANPAQPEGPRRYPSYGTEYLETLHPSTRAALNAATQLATLRLFPGAAGRTLGDVPIPSPSVPPVRGYLTGPATMAAGAGAAALGLPPEAVLGAAAAGPVLKEAGTGLYRAASGKFPPAPRMDPGEGIPDVDKPVASLGVSLSPTRAGGALARVGMGFANEPRVNRIQSMRNAPTVDARISEQLNLPPGDSLEQRIDKALGPASETYNAPRRAGEIKFDDEFQQGVKGLRDITPNIEKLQQKFLAMPSMDANEFMDELRQQRAEGRAFVRAGFQQPQTVIEGQQKLKFANLMEDLLDRHLPPEFIDQWRGSRAYTAQLLNARNAIVGDHFSVPELRWQLDHGVPLSGEMQVLAQAMDRHKAVLQEPGKIPNGSLATWTDFMVPAAGAGLAHALTNPHVLMGAGAWSGSRIGTRALLASDLYQKYGLGARQAVEQGPLPGANPAAALAQKYFGVAPHDLTLTPPPGQVSPKPSEGAQSTMELPPGREPIQLTPPPGEAGIPPSQGNLDLGTPATPAPAPRPQRPPAPAAAAVPDLGKLLAPDSGEVGEATHAYNAGPAALPFETRPDTTPQQVALGRAAMRDLLTFRDRGGRAAVLAHGLTKDFTEQGSASLIGQTATTPHDLAALAQVLRDPRFETLRAFFLKNGKIDDHIFVSSRATGASAFNGSFTDAIAERARNADGYYLLHNHPAGFADPSNADIRATQHISELAPGFLGHVIIDHNEYGLITSNNVQPNVMRTSVVKHEFGGYDPAANPEVPHVLLNKVIDTPGALAVVARQLQNPRGMTTLVSVDSKNRIRAITQYPTRDLTDDPDWGAARIRKMQQGSGGGHHTFAIAPASVDFSTLIRRGVLNGTVTPDGRPMDYGLSRQKLKVYPQQQPAAPDFERQRNYSEPAQMSLLDLASKYERGAPAAAPAAAGEVNEPYAGDWQHQLIPAELGAGFRARASMALRQQRSVQVAQLKERAFDNVNPTKSLGPSIDTQSKGISPNMQLAQTFDRALQEHLGLSPAEQLNQARAAKQSIRQLVQGPLITQNGKLMKGDTGIQTWGLALSPDYVEGRFMNCAGSTEACRMVCLGTTSGNYHQGGGGIDLANYSGPRLAALHRTFAMLHDPTAFAVQLHSEISRAKQFAAQLEEQLGTRLNILSDLNPRIHRTMMLNAHPDVSFYDYTKMPYEPIGANHHYTYSSAGLSQPAGWNGNEIPVINPAQNWSAMRARLDSGRNVAMAFTDKNHLPQWAHDVETDKRYTVVNGDAHDYRPLDQQPPGQPGVIVGLKNKKTAGQVRTAHADTDGFFVFYDPHVQLTERGTILRGAPAPGKLRGSSTATNPGVYIPPQGKMQPFASDALSEPPSWLTTP